MPIIIFVRSTGVCLRRHATKCPKNMPAPAPKTSPPQKVRPLIALVPPSPGTEWVLDLRGLGQNTGGYHPNSLWAPLRGPEFGQCSVFKGIQKHRPIRFKAVHATSVFCGDKLNAAVPAKILVLTDFPDSPALALRTHQIKTPPGSILPERRKRDTAWAENLFC